MTQRKQRLTVTIDPYLVEAGNRAVAAGQADSLSGWVNEALSQRAPRDQKLQALAAVIADYELEFGEITAEEITSQRQVDRAGAVVLRGHRAPGRGSTRQRQEGVV